MIILPDFKGKSGRWAQGKRVDGRIVRTVSGQLWKNVKERCKEGGFVQSRKPTYKGCINGFYDFQSFAEWHVSQVGYGEGYELDSDILKAGTKRYSADTCLLIPPALNRFIQSYTGMLGEWPQGMYLKNGKLIVRISYRGILTSLGKYSVTDIEEARAIYKVEKDKCAKDWYKRLCSGEFNVDKRAVEFMRTWQYVYKWESV